MFKAKQMSLVSIFAAALFSSGLMAEEEKPDENRVDESDRVSVVWVNPKEFTDVRPSSEGRKSFRNRTMKDLHQFIDKLATDLPEGHKLNLNVTDIDLAGRVWPGTLVGFNNPQDMRVVREIDIPRIHFSYELLDETGAVVKSGQEELKDMAFRDRAVNIRSHKNLIYEKNMVKRWFRKEFKDELSAS